MGYGEPVKPSGDAKLSSDQPIDDIVCDLLQTVHRKGRGFVLGLERDESGGASVEVKESLRPHDEWEAPSPYRAHTIEDTASFVAYAQRYGKPDESLVFYDDAGATLAIKEQVERGQRELVRMTFVESDDWREWSAVLGTPQSHKALLKFLMAHEGNLRDVAVLKSMQSMRLNSTVAVESDVKDDGQTFGVIVKTQGGEELKKFPKAFDISLPVLQQDVTGNAALPANATVRLEMTLPDDPKHGPAFTLWCSAWRSIKKGRIDFEGDAIRTQLDGWTVIHGAHRTNARKLCGE